MRGGVPGQAGPHHVLPLVEAQLGGQIIAQGAGLGIGKLGEGGLVALLPVGKHQKFRAVGGLPGLAGAVPLLILLLVRHTQGGGDDLLAYTLTPVVDKDNPVNNKDMFYFDSNLQVNGATSDPHKVILVTNCSLDITFTPSDMASVDVKENGMATTVSFVMSKEINELVFNGEQVFTAAELTTLQISGVGDDADASDGAVTWTRTEENGEISFTYTITQEQLVALLGITVNPALRLENSTEHATFSALITGLTIKTTVAKQA